MTKLKLDPDAREAHLNCYFQGIHDALEVLSNGRDVRFGKWFRFVPAHKQEMADYFKIFFKYNADRADSMLVAKPSVLAQLIRDENDFISQHGWQKDTAPYKECRDLVGRLFKYARFKEGKGYQFDARRLQLVDAGDIPDGRWHGKKWSPYVFIESLQVRYCPYCNAESVYAVKFEEGDAVGAVRSDLDHFYPKGKYPYLALSLQNLIPACTRCNRDIKGEREFECERVLNPYEESVHRNVEFDYGLTDHSAGWCPRDCNGFELSLEMRTGADPVVAAKAKALVDFFKVSSVYNLLFKPEAYDAIRLGRMFHSEYQGWVRKTLGNLTDEEIDRLVCRIVHTDGEINEWRLSKLAIDMRDAVARILRA